MTYHIETTKFDGYEPNSDEWRCEPEELEAYPGVALKACTGCDKLKEIYRDFSSRKGGKNGRNSRCYECERTRHDDYRKRQRTAESIEG